MRAMFAGLAAAAVTAVMAFGANPAALAGPVPDGTSAPTLIGMINSSGEAMVKQGLTGSWTNEHSGVEQVAVAGDPTNGPLIGIVTTGDQALVKEGSLSAGWTTVDGSDVRNMAIASDATHGPLIAVVTWNGELLVKE